MSTAWGRDRRHVHVGHVTQLLAQALAEGSNGELARHICAHIGSWDSAPHRGEVDQHTGVLAVEMGEGRTGAVDLPEEIGLDHGAKDLARHLPEAAVGHYASAVDPHVQATEALDRRG